MKNDIYRYRPERANNWCREGIAIELESGRRLDIYWGLTPHDSMTDHYLTAGETGTATFVANLDEYDQYTQLSHQDVRNLLGFEGYEPADRLVITSQHGLTKHLFIRKGAEVSRDAMIAAARKKISEAYQARDHALWRIQSARSDLFYAKTGHWPWQEVQP